MRYIFDPELGNIPIIEDTDTTKEIEEADKQLDEAIAQIKTND